ncbi:hypothetical protein HMI55_005246, partial [Coelomomyces lativittatus]
IGPTSSEFLNQQTNAESHFSETSSPNQEINNDQPTSPEVYDEPPSSRYFSFRRPKLSKVINKKPSTSPESSVQLPQGAFFSFRRNRHNKKINNDEPTSSESFNQPPKIETSPPLETSNDINDIDNDEEGSSKSFIQRLKNKFARSSKPESDNNINIGGSKSPFFPRRRNFSTTSIEHPPSGFLDKLKSKFRKGQTQEDMAEGNLRRSLSLGSFKRSKNQQSIHEPTDNDETR